MLDNKRNTKYMFMYIYTHIHTYITHIIQKCTSSCTTDKPKIKNKGISCFLVLQYMKFLYIVFDNTAKYLNHINSHCRSLKLAWLNIVRISYCKNIFTKKRILKVPGRTRRGWFYLFQCEMTVVTLFENCLKYWS